MAKSAEPAKLDLTAGVPVASIPSGNTVLGRVGDDDVVLARAGDRFFAVGAYCTHYHLSLIHI